MNYSAVAGAIPVNVTDDSGTGAVLIVYISDGAGWLASSGTWIGTPNPLPAACFKTTKGSSSNVVLAIPQGKSGRVYFAYATPNPNPNVIPNPFGDVSAPVSGPNVGYQAAPFPWDKIEYGTTVAGTPLIDTTQVDALGLPLELSVSANGTPMPDNTPGPCVANAVTAGSAGPFGVTSCKFDAVFQTVYANPQYRPLVYTANFNGKLLDMQVVSPSQALLTSFDWNMFGDSNTMPAVVPSPCPSPANGYLSCVLAAYQASPRVFTSAVSGAGVSAPAPYYCVSSDGSQNFVFTNIGSSASCSATPNPAASPFNIPVSLFTYAKVPDPNSPSTSICEENITFSQPFGLAFVDGAANNPSKPAGQLFGTNQAFAMWKALAADLNYGEALSTAIHPVGQVSPPPITPSQLFTDPMYNVYDKAMHDNFNGGLAYGIPYDDLYGLESGTDLMSASDSINVRINKIPAASIPLTPGAAPAAMPLPGTCSTVSAGIGS